MSFISQAIHRTSKGVDKLKSHHTGSTHKSIAGKPFTLPSSGSSGGALTPRKTGFLDRASVSHEAREKAVNSKAHHSGFHSLLQGMEANFGGEKQTRTPKELQVGTFNIGGGNKDATTYFDEITRTTADQVTHGGLDVMTLQEVDVNTKRNGHLDANEEILKDVFRAETGPDWRDAKSVDKYSLGKDGKPIIDDKGQRVYDPSKNSATVYEATFKDGPRQTQILKEIENKNGRKAYSTINEQGKHSVLELDQEKLNQNGSEDKDGPVTVYSASIQNGGRSKDYSVVSGSSIGYQGGTYGNAVLLGPEAKLQRGPDGKVVPGTIRRHDLGVNDPGSNENRTALAVEFQSGDETATVVSTHLTSQMKDEARSRARVTQYENLGKIAASYGDNVIVAGDFNSQAGSTYGTKLGNRSYPSAKDIGLLDPDPKKRSIDRIYTSNDVEASGRTDVEPYVYPGLKLDHPLVRWNVNLDG